MVAGYCSLCRVESCGVSPFTEGRLITNRVTALSRPAERHVRRGHLCDVTCVISPV